MVLATLPLIPNRNLLGRERRQRYLPTLTQAVVLTVGAFAAAACSPRVAVEVPDKPITINLNVKIDHEVRVKVEKDLDKVLSKESELF